MKDERAQLPGELLRKLLARVLTRRTFVEIIIPTLADLQYESESALQLPPWRRVFVLTRGYLGLWRVLAVHLATWPARSLSRNWLAADAAGPRLLQLLAPRVCLLGVALTLLVGHRGGRFGAHS